MIMTMHVSKVPTGANTGQKKVSADVNQFTYGNAATAVSLDLISGQFRSRLNTTRCVLNLVVRELGLPSDPNAMFE
jgi:hypothetical protein